MEASSLGYIDDGYELPGWIEPSQVASNGRRFWDGLNFTFRVATRPECKVLDAKVQRYEREALSSPDAILKADKEKCDFLAAHMKYWDMKDRGGHDVPRESKHFALLHDVLFDKLMGIVRGDWMPDVKPGDEPLPTHADQAKN